MLHSMSAGTPSLFGIQMVAILIVRTGTPTEQAVPMPTDQSGDGQPNLTAYRLPCCAGHDGPTLGHLILATLRLRNNAP